MGKGYQWPVKTICLLIALCVLVSVPLLANGYDLKLGTVTSCSDVARIPLTLTTTQDVQGFSAVFEWTGAAQGVDFIPGVAIQGADFFAKRVENNYMVIAAVIDLNGTGPSVIPAGTDINLGMVEIRCGGPDIVTNLVFADGKYSSYEGGPIVDNIIVVGGMSIGAGDGLNLVDGKLSCKPCEALAIPTLGEYGLILFVVCLGLVSLYYLKRKRMTS
jgi:hypothetical protein